FSSRRRHTRCLSDWSSDVCSSDLRRQSQGYVGGRRFEWPGSNLERSVQISVRRGQGYVCSPQQTGPECCLGVGGSAACKEAAKEIGRASCRERGGEEERERGWKGK